MDFSKFGVTFPPCGPQHKKPGVMYVVERPKPNSRPEALRLKKDGACTFDGGLIRYVPFGNSRVDHQQTRRLEQARLKQRQKTKPRVLDEPRKEAPEKPKNAPVQRGKEGGQLWKILALVMTGLVLGYVIVRLIAYIKRGGPKGPTPPADSDGGSNSGTDRTAGSDGNLLMVGHAPLANVMARSRVVGRFGSRANVGSVVALSRSTGAMCPVSRTPVSLRGLLGVGAYAAAAGLTWYLTRGRSGAASQTFNRLAGALR